MNLIDKKEGSVDGEDDSTDGKDILVDKEDDSKEITVTIEDDDEEKAEGKSLPKTATAYYTILLAGLLLSVIGGTIYFLKRRKQIE